MKFKEILVTNCKDFSLLKHLSNNREIEKRKDIENSLRKIGFKGAISVVEYTGKEIEKGLYIVNGQHRHNECMLQDIPFNYLIIDSTNNIEDLYDLTIALNTDNRNWTISDCVKSFSKRGYSHYITISNISKDYGVSLATATKLLANDTSMKVERSLRYGKFQVTHLDLTCEILDEIRKFRKFTKIYMRHVEGFAKFYCGVTNYNSKKFINVLSLTKMIRLSEKTDSQKFFERIHKKSLEL